MMTEQASKEIFIRIGYCLIISLLGVTVFYNHLNNPFQFDSVAYIANNAKLQNPENFLTLEFWKNNFLARGLLRMSIAINAALDGMNPFGYHVFNLIFHTLNSILLFFVLDKSFRYLHFDLIRKDNTQLQTIAFFSALFFLCHPIQTESVIYIISRSEVIASTFYLGGILLFQKLLERSSTSSIQYIFYYSTISLIALTGFSVKQIVATLPAVMFLYYLCGCKDNSAALRTIKIWKWELLGIALGITGLLFYKLLSDESFLIGPTNPQEMVGRAKYMLSQPGVIVFYYFNKLLLPINLNIDPDIEVVTSIFSFKFIFPFLCIVFLIIFSLIKSRLIFFFLCWFFIILSPSSSIITLHDLAAEHRIYLASAGILTLITILVYEVYAKICIRLPRSFITIGLCLLIGILGFLTIKRNTVWKTELSLWQDTYDKSPDKLRPLINLARAHSIEGNNEKAIQYYKESLTEGPLVFASNYNLGELYFKKGMIHDALRHFLLASRIEPQISESFARLGEIFLLEKKFEIAESYFKRAVELNPNFPQVFKNLGVLNFYHLDKPEQGLAYFSRSLTLDPNQPEASQMQHLLKQINSK
jgi:protein O-mannosyl-transferase